MVFLLGVTLYSIYDRHYLNVRMSTVESFKQNYEASARPMLDARAKIQVLNVQANYDKFSPAQRERIKSLWQQAEYDRVISYESFSGEKP